MAQLQVLCLQMAQKWPLSKAKRGNGLMSNEIQKTDSSIVPGFGNLQSFEFTQRAASLLANSTLVPKTYQGNLPNCVIALNMAARIGADPLMVMQSLYIVHGRPAWSSQFMIATFNTCGRFSAIRYKWVGERGKDSHGCYAYAAEKATGEILEGSTVTIEIAKAEGWYNKDGSKWKSLPDQMLMYRAASWFVRAYAPELALGMHTQEEIIDITPEPVDIVQETIRQNANKDLVDIPDNPIKHEENPGVNPPPTTENQPGTQPPLNTAAGSQTEQPGNTTATINNLPVDGPDF